MGKMKGTLAKNYAHDKTMAMPVKNKPKASGRAPTNGFKPGQSGNPAGRAAGTRNRTTIALKNAILMAAELVGDEMAKAKAEKVAKRDRINLDDAFLVVGPDGLVGYLVEIFRTDFKVAGSLLGRVLPLVLEGGENPITIDVRERAIKFTALMEKLSERMSKGGSIN
jgi:hypothetical protein